MQRLSSHEACEEEPGEAGDLDHDMRCQLAAEEEGSTRAHTTSNSSEYLPGLGEADATDNTISEQAVDHNGDAPLAAGLVPTLGIANILDVECAMTRSGIGACNARRASLVKPFGA